MIQLRKRDSITNKILALLTDSGLIIITVDGIGLIPSATLKIVESILSTTASLNGFTSVMLSMTWTKRKKKDLKQGQNLLKNIKKLFYYSKKVKEDGITTIKEFDTKKTLKIL